MDTRINFMKIFSLFNVQVILIWFFRCASISRNYSGRWVSGLVSEPQFRQSYNAVYSVVQLVSQSVSPGNPWNPENPWYPGNPENQGNPIILGNPEDFGNVINLGILGILDILEIKEILPILEILTSYASYASYASYPNIQIAKCWSFPHSAWRLVKCARLSVFRVEVLLLSKRIFRGFELVSAGLIYDEQLKSAERVNDQRHLTNLRLFDWRIPALVKYLKEGVRQMLTINDDKGVGGCEIFQNWLT